jgi:hypothetical protein
MNLPEHLLLLSRYSHCICCAWFVDAMKMFYFTTLQKALVSCSQCFAGSGCS